MSKPTQKKCKTHEFTILNPQKFSWKNQFCVQVNGEFSRVSGNHFELINMSVCFFMEGQHCLICLTFMYTNFSFLMYFSLRRRLFSELIGFPVYSSIRFLLF